jgi:tripartite-type tricarboxylate transporter receptor subunit TctC
MARNKKHEEEGSMKWLRIAAAAALVLCCAHALAQPFPAKPVKIVVTFAAGGSADIFVRAMAPFLSAELGQPVIIENKPGAGNIIAAEYVARSPADGYTLLLAPDPVLATNPLLYSKLPYDAIKDFAPVSLLVRFGLGIVVSAALPVNSLQELVAYAKANPGKLNYGSFGPGTAPHLVMELFNSVAGVSIVHVPYKGVAPVLTDLIAGVVQASSMSAGPAVPGVKSGRLRMLAVDGGKRSPLMPDVPTFAEAGFAQVQAPAWWGLVAPAATPRAVIDRLHRDIVKVLKNPAFYEANAVRQGSEPVGSTPAEFAAAKERCPRGQPSDRLRPALR